jgi:hypothetical protein
VPDNYRLSPGEPTAIAKITEVLAQAHQMAGERPLPQVAADAALHPDTVLSLLTWHIVAGADPEAAYERGLELPPATGTKRQRRHRLVSKRLRRPRFDTLTRLAGAMGCKEPRRVAELAASRAPHVVIDLPESVS